MRGRRKFYPSRDRPAKFLSEIIGAQPFEAADTIDESIYGTDRAPVSGASWSSSGHARFPRQFSAPPWRWKGIRRWSSHSCGTTTIASHGYRWIKTGSLSQMSGTHRDRDRDPYAPDGREAGRLVHRADQRAYPWPGAQYDHIEYDADDYSDDLPFWSRVETSAHTCCALHPRHQ